MLQSTPAAVTHGADTTLAIHARGDVYERDADRVAERVMHRPEERRPAKPIPLKEDAGAPTVPLARAPLSDSTEVAAPHSVHEALASPGQPLDPATRRFMEPRFDHDFSEVRVHSGAVAERSAQAVNARAYAVGNSIVLGAGQPSPQTQEGQRLLAHELTHVVQQCAGSAAVQRQPAPTPAPAPDPEREAAVAEVEAIASHSTEALEAQADAEDALKLKAKRRRDVGYALSLGAKDTARIQRRGAVSPELQYEITVKIRFFEGDAKGAYIRTITAAVAEFAEADQVAQMLAEPASSGATGGTAPRGPSCDIRRKEFPLEYEGDPGGARCVAIGTDPEYRRDYFDTNIIGAVGYSVKGTTWENVKYSSFNVLLVKYRNGTSEYFMLDDVGNFHYGGASLVTLDHGYLKRQNGLVYPISNGRLYFNEVLAPRLLAYKNGLPYQVTELQKLYTLLQVAGTFANIIGSYSVVEAFRASLQGFRVNRGPAGGSPSGGEGEAEAPRLFEGDVGEDVETAFRTLPEGDPHSGATTDPNSQIRSQVMIGGEPQQSGPGKGGVPASNLASTDPKARVQAGATEVLDIGAGTQRPDLGVPPERSLVAVTSSDVNEAARPDVVLDATQPIPATLRGRFTTLIINNPYGYRPNVGALREALGPDGKIIVQGNWEANKYFRALGTGEVPSGMTRTIERGLPPSAILGEGFRTSSGEAPVLPNARITFEAARH
jgi:hypothetical protein